MTGWIQGIWSIGGHDDLGLPKDIKPIHLVQQFHQGTLYFSICTASLTESPSSYGVNFIHEDDTGLVVLCIAKHLPNDASRLTNVLVYDGRGDHFDEIGLEGGCDSPGEEGLAGTWGTIQEDALGWLDADTKKEFWIDEGEFNDLTEGSDLF